MVSVQFSPRQNEVVIVRVVKKRICKLVCIRHDPPLHELAPLELSKACLWTPTYCSVWANKSRQIRERQENRSYV